MKPYKCICGDNKDICIDCMQDWIDIAEDKLNKIEAWTKAYPLQVFPEPDFAKAAKVLKNNGMTLDSISASNMRHVLDGIKRIIGV